MKRILLGGFTLLLLSIGFATSGCSSNATIKEDPAVLSKRTDSAKQIRTYFDKSNGNYDALSAADKTALNAITGSEEHSRTAFGHMVPGGAPANAPRSN